ncbi:aromatic amino acid transporter [Rodentibacter sp. Ppn85]|uniref:aromatic amino acid transporter n=1 Tax=Rodentibacter sp. Ppn85 TaxID=1908525 RepID=UPI0009863ECC|nr:aromatic amino acid transporter [Rodentibacter sp. Ppn85]OOF65459.1 transposase [Rodentibacter sp. Ppn85]
MKKQPSIFGGSCIIASVCVGAGMLGLPTSGAGAWTIWSAVAICLTMILMTLSGWLLLEAYSTYDLRASFSTVTKDMLGSTINAINNLAVYFVGGILLYAYTTASGGIIENLIKPWINLGSSGLAICSTIFVLVFSYFVWHSTRIVDRISVLLIVFMGLTFVISISGLAVNISLDKLFDIGGKEGAYAKYAIGMFPVALTSFGYHHSVCSMRAYYGEERKAKYAILGGTGIALTLYLIWVFVIFGNLPRDQFAPILESGGNLDVLLNTLGNVIESNTVKQMINAFSIAAILSSFIGVGLGVFDYLADFFKFDDSKTGRAKSWIVTFLPPLIMSILFPLGFLKAIGYAGAVATIWTCIIPALLVYKSRKRYHTTGFRVGGGNGLIIFTALFGVFVAIAHFLAMFNYLPNFKG